MRVAFLLAILTGSALYTYAAFAELAFLSVTGRLGPGFFPRLIGIGLVLCCLLNLWPDLRKGRFDDFASPRWPVVGLVIALSGGLVLMFSILGGTLSMVAFLLVALSILNRGRHVQNVVIAILLPAGVYFLFDKWLNASMPEGMLPLPI